MASATQARTALLTLLTPVVAARGLDLEDVSVSPVGRRSLVRVTVDADGGIDLDDVAEVSRVVSDAIDTAGADPTSELARGVLAGAYVLEVSSPGVDRPLREPRHWRRATGRLVGVEVDGVGRTARVVGADGSAVRLADPGHPERVESVEYARLGAGRVQVEFTRPGTDAPVDDPADDPADGILHDDPADGIRHDDIRHDDGDAVDGGQR